MCPASTADPTPQAAEAVRMYTPRAAGYDGTWHPAMAAVFPSWIPNLGPETQLLDLACGTGLISVSAARAIGPRGRVTGVDVTPAMLAEAQAKTIASVTKHRREKETNGDQGRQEEGGQHEALAPCRWLLGDVTALSEIRDQDQNALPLSSFDVITCCSAFQFFAERAAVVRSWAEYLKPGGSLVLDVPAPCAQVIDGTLETVMRDVTGQQLIYRRDWVKDEESVAEVARAAGLKVERIFETSGFGSERSATLDELDAAWNYQMRNMPQLVGQLGDDRLAEVRRQWEEKLRAVADEHGVVHERESYYILVARKPE